MAKLTVSSHFVRAALSGAERQGKDVAELLRCAGIPLQAYQNPRSRVGGPQYTKLMQCIWKALQDEFMGLTDTVCKTGTFATMCYLVVHCNNLESVLRRGRIFYSLFDKPVTLKLEVHGDQAVLIVDAEATFHDPYHFFQESLLVIWHRFACWLTGQRVALDEARFNYPEPEHSSEYRHLFYCPLQFNQPDTRIYFHKRYLQLPVIQDEPSLKEFLKTSPADLLARPDDSNTYTSKIRALVGRDLSQQMPDFEFIASQINVSPQTLRRRLKEENTSFQEIKDNMRRDAAIYYLSRREMSINEIAFKVGFTEPSTFHRAFKKWTGVTPGEYRESVLRERQH
ncbi:helix-turn-helix domain-containing protein [Hahella sp. KA22]|uniref:AraC family transcriptional regulator n=1 Tax=Hahella sp. KA22 TaxID=1628392 RepID=UPI000FDEEFB9|nr:AraC family transcriptional regulator [Hahella sp. KA22]AZZ91455.1 AraC family transcriptional regulator [Hahella sp. KA22]QAY54824.1 helix-turn-helix domain-containing protein [Hahella sp. KA22]